MRKLISHQQEEAEEQSAVLQRLREEELYRKECEKAQEEEIVRLRVLKENAKGNDFEMQVRSRVKNSM